MQIFYKDERITEVETINEAEDIIKKYGQDNEPIRLYFYKDFLAVMDSLESTKAYIKNYERKNLAFYQEMIEESHAIENEVKKVRPIKNDIRSFHSGDYETYEQYQEFFKKKRPDLFERITNLGQKFYKDKFIETFVHNSENDRFGFLVRLDPWQGGYYEEGTRKECVAGLGLKCCTKFANAWQFEARQGDMMVQFDKLNNKSAHVWSPRVIEEYTDMSDITDAEKGEIIRFLQDEMVKTYLPDYKTVDQIAEELANIKECFNDYAYFGVDRHHDKIIGTIALSQLDNEMFEMQNLYVSEPMRHREVATGLIIHAFDFVADKASIRLKVGKECDAARRLFERLSFAITDAKEAGNETIYTMQRNKGSWESWRVVYRF